MDEGQRKAEKYMLIPTFKVVEHRGCIIPSIYLPLNFKEIVPAFYKQGRKEEIEIYSKDLQDILKNSPFETEAVLNWSDELGLASIRSTSAVGGSLDLNVQGQPSFQEHNMGTRHSFVLGAIAQKYLSELLKSE